MLLLLRSISLWAIQTLHLNVITTKQNILLTNIPIHMDQLPQTSLEVKVHQSVVTFYSNHSAAANRNTCYISATTITLNSDHTSYNNHITKQLISTALLLFTVLVATKSLTNVKIDNRKLKNTLNRRCKSWTFNWSMHRNEQCHSLNDRFH